MVATLFEARHQTHFRLSAINKNGSHSFTTVAATIQDDPWVDSPKTAATSQSRDCTREDNTPAMHKEASC